MASLSLKNGFCSFFYSLGLKVQKTDFASKFQSHVPALEVMVASRNETIVWLIRDTPGVATDQEFLFGDLRVSQEDELNRISGCTQLKYCVRVLAISFPVGMPAFIIMVTDDDDADDDNDDDDDNNDDDDDDDAGRFMTGCPPRMWSNRGRPPHASLFPPILGMIMMMI